MSILNVENLSHGFGDKTLFRNISFRLSKGEHIGLIGANGAGKTTFFNFLTGDLLPDEGDIQWSSGTRVASLDQHARLKAGHSIRETLREAFMELYEIEQRLMDVSHRLAQTDGEEMEKLLRIIGNLQDTLEKENFYGIDSRIDGVADGLGLRDLGMDRPVDELSGGQRTKVLLAKLLLESPDILLLDEPTNYLDKEHVEWLTDYLRTYPGSLILISHDTHFLNEVVNIIYHVEFTRMKRYPGNYKKFMELHDQQRNEYILQYTRQQDEINRMEDFIRKNIARASTSGQAKSRRKQLGKIERMEKPQTIAKPSFFFTAAREPGRLIFESLELEIGYSLPLFPKMDLRVEKGEKIAITGFNGIGKTTLLKTIMGMLPALGGVLEYGEALFPAYFEQEGSVSRDQTAMEVIWEAFPQMAQGDIRKALARCGLKQEHILKPMRTLSGGEQSKVRLCRLMLSPTNWLLLDEPTNHLDMDAKASLKECLAEYPGTILLVSHEESFYRSWVTGVWNLEKVKKRK